MGSCADKIAFHIDPKAWLHTCKIHQIDATLKIVLNVHENAAQIKEGGLAHRCIGDIDIAVGTRFAPRDRSYDTQQLNAAGSCILSMGANRGQGLIQESNGHVEPLLLAEVFV
nr:hypothetical protein [Phenylobacterium sp.]